MKNSRQINFRQNCVSLYSDWLIFWSLCKQILWINQISKDNNIKGEYKVDKNKPCKLISLASDHSAIFLTDFVGGTVKIYASTRGPGFESRQPHQKGHRSIVCLEFINVDTLLYSMQYQCKYGLSFMWSLQLMQTGA